MAKRLPVVVYGATGFTGNLICDELSRRKVEFAIAGRNRDKLEALASRLETRPEVQVAEVDDVAALQGICARARVVLSAAGPFRIYGKAVQEAALKAGTHFLDITGESSYMLDTWANNSAWVERGVVAVNAVGFDVVPTDMAAWLACEGLGAIDKVEIGLHVRGGGLTRGTQRSAYRMLAEPSTGYEDGDWRPLRAGAFKKDLDFGAGVGIQHTLSVPLGDIATAPRTTGARTVRVFAAVPGVVTTFAPPLFALGQLSPVRALFGTRVVTSLANRLIDRAPEGPDPMARERQNWTTRADAWAADGRRRTAYLRGRDAYGVTAVMATEMALRVASPTYNRKGVLTPSQAVDVKDFLDSIRDCGVTWEQDAISG